jgi:hypothetical protein
MCWNKEVSFATLAIGTAFNILLVTSTTHPSVLVVAGIWQFVLFMQLFEGLSWVSKETKSSTLSDFSTKCAFVFNVLQPVVAALLVLSITESTRVKYALSLLSAVYLVVLLYSVASTSFAAPMYSNSDTCRHLQLYWWGQFSIWVFIFYMILFGCACLSIAPPHLGRVQYAYIVATLLLSLWLYPCTYGSIWCWFAAFAPLVMYLYLQARPV